MTDHPTPSPVDELREIDKLRLAALTPAEFAQLFHDSSRLAGEKGIVLTDRIQLMETYVQAKITEAYEKGVQDGKTD